ncbi:MAG: carbohydrate ABC transporter permease, partial [Rudaea sp.]
MPLAVILVLFLIWPAAFGFLASFTDYAPAQLHTHFVGLENYAAVVGDGEFGATARNSLTFGLLSVPAELVVGFLIAYLLRTPFRGRGLLRLVLFIPWLISATANGVMWHFIYNSQKGLFSFFFAWLGSPGLPSPLGMPDLALPAVIM